MSHRAHAVSVLSRRRILEALIRPGLYVAQTIGLVLAYLLVTGFISAVDSSGFDYALHPAYGMIGRALAGAFGEAFVERLFSEGPFLLVLYVALAPVLLCLSLGSVFHFGLDRKVGALELLACGPADGTSYFLAALVKDILLTALHLVVLLLFLLIGAALNNLVVGPSFSFNLIALFFLSVAIYSYGILSSCLTDGSASAIAVFLGLMLLFAVLLMGSFAAAGGYVRRLAGVLGWLLRWISPLHYWRLALSFAEVGNWLMYSVAILLVTLLSAAVLVVSHLTMRARGVRP